MVPVCVSRSSRFARRWNLLRGGVSRPADKVIDGAPYLTAGVREIDGNEAPFHRSCLFWSSGESKDEAARSVSFLAGARRKER